MVKEVPRQFRGKYPNSATASYSWTDIASGEGYKDFYCYAVTSGTAGIVYYHASAQATFSNPTSVNNPNTTYNFVTSTFNKPATIKGNALIYLSRGARTGPSPSTATLTTNIIIYKVSGATETQIGQVYAKSVSIAHSSSYKADPEVLNCTLTQTNLKRGDYLKFSLVFTAGGSNVHQTAFAFDPSSSDVTIYDGYGTTTLSNTQLKFSIPFRIDL